MSPSETSVYAPLEQRKTHGAPRSSATSYKRQPFCIKAGCVLISSSSLAFFSPNPQAPPTAVYCHCSTCICNHGSGAVPGYTSHHDTNCFVSYPFTRRRRGSLLIRIVHKERSVSLLLPHPFLTCNLHAFQMHRSLQQRGVQLHSRAPTGRALTITARSLSSNWKMHYRKRR